MKEECERSMYTTKEETRLALPADEICRRLENHLIDLLDLDAALPLVERYEYLEHAKNCPRCFEVLRTYRKTVSLLRSLPKRRAPADFLSWVR